MVNLVAIPFYSIMNFGLFYSLIHGRGTTLLRVGSRAWAARDNEVEGLIENTSLGSFYRTS